MRKYREKNHCSKGILFHGFGIVKPLTGCYQLPRGDVPDLLGQSVSGYVDEFQEIAWNRAEFAVLLANMREAAEDVQNFHLKRNRFSG